MLAITMGATLGSAGADAAAATLLDGGQLLRVAFCLFALAAVGGLVMAGIRLGAKRNPPMWLAYGHGLLAAAGLTLLAYAEYATTMPSNASIALWLLVFAAAGGSILNLGFHWRQQPLPKGLMFGHILLAVIGVALLFTAAY